MLRGRCQLTELHVTRTAAARSAFAKATADTSARYESGGWWAAFRELEPSGRVAAAGWGAAAGGV